MKKLVFTLAALSLLIGGQPTRAFTERISVENTCTKEDEIINLLKLDQREEVIVDGSDAVASFEMNGKNSPYYTFIPNMVGLGVDRIYIIAGKLKDTNHYKIDHVFGVNKNTGCILIYFTFPDEILKLMASEHPDWSGHPKQDYQIGVQTHKWGYEESEGDQDQ